MDRTTASYRGRADTDGIFHVFYWLRLQVEMLTDHMSREGATSSSSGKMWGTLADQRQPRMLTAATAHGSRWPTGPIPDPVAEARRSTAQVRYRMCPFGCNVIYGSKPKQQEEWARNKQESLNSQGETSGKGRTVAWALEAELRKLRGVISRSEEKESHWCIQHESHFLFT